MKYVSNHRVVRRHASSVLVTSRARASSRRRLDDSGQSKLWQVGLLLVVLVVLGFDLIAPQIVKVQLSDKAKSAALDASQTAVRSTAASYAQRYDTVCSTVTKALEDYGATLIPPRPDSDCPDLDMDGTVSFSAEKSAPSLVLKYLGLKNYYTVRVDVSVRYAGGI